MKNQIVVEKIVIDLKTGERKKLYATVQTEHDDTHTFYSLTYEGYRSQWSEVRP